MREKVLEEDTGYQILSICRFYFSDGLLSHTETG